MTYRSIVNNLSLIRRQPHVRPLAFEEYYLKEALLWKIKKAMEGGGISIPYPNGSYIWERSTSKEYNLPFLAPPPNRKPFPGNRGKLVGYRLIVHSIPFVFFLRSGLMHGRIVTLLSLGHMVTDINQGVVPALLPFFIATHSLSYTAAAGIVLASTISSTVIQPLFGHFADRMSKPWLLPFGLMLAGGGMALTGIAPGYWWIVAAALVSGIGVAAYHPEAARLVNRAAGPKKAMAMSIFGVGGTLGFAIGPLLGTAVLLNLGLAGTLVLLAPVSLLAVAVATYLPWFAGLESRARASDAARKGPPLQDMWGPFGRLTTVVIGRSILFYALNTFIPLYWINVLNQSKVAGGTALTVFAAAGVIGNLIGGKLADRFGYRRVMRLSFILMIPFMPLLVYTTVPIAAMLVLVPIGFAMSAAYSPIIVTGQRYLPNRVGFSAGITIGVAVAIGGVATPVLGRVADLHGIWMALAVLTVLPVFNLLMSYTLPKPKTEM